MADQKQQHCSTQQEEPTLAAFVRARCTEGIEQARNWRSLSATGRMVKCPCGRWGVLTKLAPALTVSHAGRADGEEEHAFENDPERAKSIWDQFPIPVEHQHEINVLTALLKLAQWHSGRHVCEDDLAGTRWSDEADDIVEEPCDELRMISGVWMDHPDYRPEWRLDS